MFNLLQVTGQTAADLPVDQLSVFLDSLRTIEFATLKDSMDQAAFVWDEQSFNFMKGRDYYLAVTAIVLAIVSLIVDLLTSFFQWRSSKSGANLSSSITLVAQTSKGISICVKLFENVASLYVLGLRLGRMPSIYWALKMGILNEMSLDAECRGDEKLLSRVSDLNIRIKNYNDVVSACAEKFDSDDSANMRDMSRIVDGMIEESGAIARMILRLLADIKSYQIHGKRMPNDNVYYKEICQKFCHYKYGDCNPERGNLPIEPYALVHFLEIWEMAGLPEEDMLARLEMLVSRIRMRS